MFWTLLFYLFLVMVFVVFLRLSKVKFHGKRVFNWPMRFTISLFFPLVFVLVALFSSIFLLFVMALLLICLLVFFILFLLGRVQRIIVMQEPVVVHKVKKKRKK